MKLADSAHTDQDWRIHEVAPDFVLDDVWALPTPGGPGELPRVVEAIFDGAFPEGAPRLVQLLWNARWKLGAVLGWDEKSAGLSRRVPSVRDRLTPGLLAASTEPNLDLGRFSFVYQLEDEFAAELANRTVHTIMHLGWVSDHAGGYRCQMAVLVKPNGRLGSLYMAGIDPIRRLIVYPALLRQIGREWRATTPTR